MKAPAHELQSNTNFTSQDENLASPNFVGALRKVCNVACFAIWCGKLSFTKVVAITL